MLLIEFHNLNQVPHSKSSYNSAISIYSLTYLTSLFNLNWIVSDDNTLQVNSIHYLFKCCGPCDLCIALQTSSYTVHYHRIYLVYITLYVYLYVCVWSLKVFKISICQIVIFSTFQSYFFHVFLYILCCSLSLSAFSSLLE